MSKTPTLYRGSLIVEADPRIAALVPHAKQITHDGKVWTVVPHKLDEYKVMRNLGYDVAPPILTDYDWPVVNGFAPFDAQRYTAALIASNERCFVLNDLGTGKTRSALFAFDYLRKCGMVNKMLVVAPLSTLRRTWWHEVMQTFSGMKCTVLYGTAEKRKKLLAEDADIYVINHDGVEIVLAELIARKDIDMVVYDELTAIKTATTTRAKVAQKLIASKQRVIGMTGLVTPQAPTDAYGQIKAITPSRLAGWSFTRFREHTMRKITNFKWLPRDDATERVFKFLQPSIRFTRDQCIGLPPCQYVDYECKLTDPQKKLFDTIRKEFAAQIATGEITTANAADKANKMLQVVLGFVHMADGSITELDCAPRLSVLDDIIAASHGKVIVYTPYVHSLKMLKAHLSKSVTVECVSGATAVGERDRIFARFQQTQSLRVLAAHPMCMSHGLTLTEASTIVWFGLPPSPEIYEQANARITRPGQKRSQYIAHICATTFELAKYKNLHNRTDNANLLMDLVKAQQLSSIL